MPGGAYPGASLNPATPTTQRVLPLDALRGVAVIGIVLMNVFYFSMPPAAYLNPRAYGGTGPAEIAAWAISFVLIEDKGRALFAALFGAGVTIFLSKASRSRMAEHYVRMIVLLVIGFLHAILFASNDVLRLYAVIGLVLPLLVRLRITALVVLSGLLVALHMAAGGWVAWGWLDYWWQLDHVPGTDPASMQFAERAFGADPQAIAQGLAMGRESLGERVARQLSDQMAVVYSGIAFLPMTLATALAGSALWKSGMLAGKWPPRAAARLGAAFMTITILPLTGLAVFAIRTDFNPAIVATNALVWSAPFDLLLGLGWAAVLIAWLQSHAGSAATKRLAAAGRMALTNYIGSSVVLSAIFASWGLGVFGEVGRFGAYAAALAPIALMLLLSPLWLKKFRQGPVEWAWRTVARINRRHQPTS